MFHLDIYQPMWNRKPTTTSPKAHLALCFASLPLRLAAEVPVLKAVQQPADRNISKSLGRQQNSLLWEKVCQTSELI